MAAKGSRGSFLLEILIVLLILLLVAVIIIPNQIWQEENKITETCRNNLIGLNEGERFYHQKTGSYTDTLTKLLTVIQSDSGLKQRQMLVSLTQSFLKVVNNILEIPSINNIANISRATFEITGDLMGNDRYFRNYEDILEQSQEIMREIMRIDSSAAFPNFSASKVFVDSLRDLRESVSDYTLQNAILRAINAIDSLKLYFPKIEKEEFNTFWENEYAKISGFIQDVRATDISKVSTVPDRLKKFIDQINRNVQDLNAADLTANIQRLEAEKQNLNELHQKFLSTEFFMVTKRYSLTALNEIDSILINLSQEDFIGPDANERYIVDTTRGRLTVECPNLLDVFQQNFLEIVQPVQNLPFYDQVNEISAVFDSTIVRLDENRALLRRYTDVLLRIKELLVEMEQMDHVFFYRYTNDLQEFLELVQNEKKLSVLTPAIEDILNPIDTLAARIESGNVSDLEKRLNYFNTQLTKLDSIITEMRLPSRIRRRVQSNTETFQPAFDIIIQIKNQFDPANARKLRETADQLEQALLEALEGKQERVYVIFTKDHINHGYIKADEKSWEAD